MQDLFLFDIKVSYVPHTSLGVKRLAREADHSPQPSAEVKNAWSSTSSPTISLHGAMLSYSTGTNLPFHLNNLAVFYSKEMKDKLI
jgi:hypothetical protein